MSLVQITLEESDARQVATLLRLLSGQPATRLAHLIETHINFSLAAEAHKQWTAHVSHCIICNAALNEMYNWPAKLCDEGKALRNTLIKMKEVSRETE